MRGLAKNRRPAAAKPGNLGADVERMDLASGVPIQTVLVERRFRIAGVRRTTQVGPSESVAQRRPVHGQRNYGTQNRAERHGRDLGIPSVANLADTARQAADGPIEELVGVLFGRAGFGLKELEVGRSCGDKPTRGGISRSLYRTGAGVQTDENRIRDQDARRLIASAGPAHGSRSKLALALAFRALPLEFVPAARLRWVRPSLVYEARAVASIAARAARRQDSGQQNHRDRNDREDQDECPVQTIPRHSLSQQLKIYRLPSRIMIARLAPAVSEFKRDVIP